MAIKRSVSICMFVLFVNSIATGAAESEYLGDNQRTGYADVEAPRSPALLWTYCENHPPKHAWAEPNREVQYIDFDYATQTAIGQGMVFFGSSADHKLYALDLKSGEEKWTFYTEGPVRFAPVVREERVYVASDDSCLYCLKAGTGELIWKFRGGPGDEKLIGNDQMISHWPARSGVLIEKDRLFFTAGMWSRDGVFIFCLNPGDGSVIWKNDTSGFHFMTMPHAAGFGGVAPQGYLLHHRNMLYVPTGRGAPACFNAETGEFLWFENGLGYKPHQAGGSWVMAYKDWIIFKRREQHTEESVRYEERDPGPSIVCGLFALDYRTGETRWSLTDKNLAVARGDSMIMAGAGPVIKVNFSDLMAAYPKYYRNGKTIAFDKNITDPGVPYINTAILKWAQNMSGKIIPNPAWMSPVPFSKWATDVGRVYFMLQAQNIVLAGGRGNVTALDAETGNIVWQRSIDGDGRGICAGDGRFIVSSTAGKLYCFGEGGSDSGKEIKHVRKGPAIEPETKKLADSILRLTGVKAGYCLILGAGDGQLVCELADRSGLVIYCLEPDERKVASVRKILDDAGLLGVRAAVHHAALDKLPYIQYVANLIIWGDRMGSGIGNVKAKELYRVLRPYGGVACQLAEKDATSATRQWLSECGVSDKEVSESPLGLMVRRGKLRGAGEWTHPHADIGRTDSSGDRLARLPLGMLWWGGPGPERIVSRHWRAPVPLFSNGVLFIQGQHDVIGVDAYNGREMWNRHLENVGRFPPTHRGGNIVADQDSVYCIQGLKCLRLDAQTGETLHEYTFPLGDIHKREMGALLSNNPRQEGDSRIVWEFLGLSGDRIIGTLGNEMQSQQSPYSDDTRQSRYVFAFDKVTGRLLWEHLLDRVVSPVAIVADEGRVYLLDRTDEFVYQQRKRRGKTDGLESSLKALDIATGRVFWEKKGIPLERKALMLKDDAIVAAPSPAEKDRKEADSGVAVYSAKNGDLLWEKKALDGISQQGRGWEIRHSFIIGDTLFLPWAFDLHTGAERLLREDPLTGDRERFNLPGKSFCGTVAAGGDIVAYRSACVGFQEISRDSGSYWFPETRPSCWISVIPAGGMVLAPEGYSSCICPYNYKTSLALVPVERNEDWSIYLSTGSKEIRTAREIAKEAKKRGKKGKEPLEEKAAVGRVRVLRANLNAPGDRMDTDGKVWMAYPRPMTGSRYITRELPIEHSGEEKRFRRNSDYCAIDGTQKPWLYASGMQGRLLFTIQLSDNEEHTYTVRLHFAEPDDIRPGERVFDVKARDKTILSHLDIVKEAGAPNRALVKEVGGVSAKGTMTIELMPAKGKAPLICSLEIIEE